MITGRSIDKRLGQVLFPAFTLLLALTLFSAPAVGGQADSEQVTENKLSATDDDVKILDDQQRSDSGYEGVDGNLRKYLRTPRRRGGVRRALTEADVRNVILVANDVAPEWGASLQSKLDENPDSLRESIGQNGRRLLGLAMLRERNPTLYKVRVNELRCNRSLQAASDAYRQAIRDGREEDSSTLHEEIRGLVAQSLDLELQARAMELAALDKALTELKSALQLEIRTQQERMQERLDEVLAEPDLIDTNASAASRSS